MDIFNKIAGCVFNKVLKELAKKLKKTLYKLQFLLYVLSRKILKVVNINNFLC